MTLPFQFSIRKFRRLASTSTTAQQYAKQGSPEGLVIVADHQTQGRGRLGRKWVSPAGKDLLFSILLRPPLSPSKAPLLSQVICRSVALVLKKYYRLLPAFKRPNDLLIQGKKICGVLLESQSNGCYSFCHSRESGNPKHGFPIKAFGNDNFKKVVDYVVIGIGLNVNSSISKQVPTAISLKELQGKELRKELVLKRILNQIRKDLQGIYASGT